MIPRRCAIMEAATRSVATIFQGNGDGVRPALVVQPDGDVVVIVLERIHVDEVAQLARESKQGRLKRVLDSAVYC